MHLSTAAAAMGPVSMITPARMEPTKETEPAPAWSVNANTNTTQTKTKTQQKYKHTKKNKYKYESSYLELCFDRL